MRRGTLSKIATRELWLHSSVLYRPKPLSKWLRWLHWLGMGIPLEPVALHELPEWVTRGEFNIVQVNLPGDPPTLHPVAAYIRSFMSVAEASSAFRANDSAVGAYTKDPFVSSSVFKLL